MRLSPRLCHQHIGWNFKKLWQLKQNRKVIKTGVEKKLIERGIPVYQPSDILEEKTERPKLNIVGLCPKPTLFDHTHPKWHEEPLWTYKDNNVLVEGISQAKILTNTVEIQQGLPNTINLKSTKHLDARFKAIILSSHVYDAEQKKLPKLKDPARPAWNFPRVYGITQARVIKLLLRNILHLIECNSDFDVINQRQYLDEMLFSYNFHVDDKLVQFELKGDTILLSNKPLKPITSETGVNVLLPDIFPLAPTISLTEENIYDVRGIYPVNLKFPKSHPHTVFVHHVDADVQNLYEEPVTEPQIFGRALLKTFTVAASYAKEKYGNTIKKLPKPVTVQCVYTNGKLFHFGLFQLNTLDLQSTENRNLWYQTERMSLFEECCYKKARPVLEGYNSNVLEHLYAFYNNVNC